MLLSRVAGNMYWAGRYLERAEDTARIIRSYSDMIVDLPVSVMSSWEPLLAIAGATEAFDEVSEPADEASIVHFLVAETANPGSVLMCVSQARENLRSTREVLPREVWQTLNDLFLFAESHRHEGVGRRSRGRFLERVVGESRRIDGMVMATMNRDAAYEFLAVGQSLERADMTTRVLGVHAAGLMAAGEDTKTHVDVQWMSVLSSLSALHMYHRSTRSPVAGPDVVSFLLGDPAFPRSVSSCLTRLTHRLERLPRANAVLPAVRAVEAEVARVDPADTDGKTLDHAMDGLQLALGEVHERIVATYLLAPVTA